VGVPAAPRIDDRLRRFIAGSSLFDSPAQVTRSVGDLAWELGLPRPCYEQVRMLLGGAAPVRPAATGSQTTKGRVVIANVNRALDFLYQYPGPGLADWYSRYKRGLV
jgi:hypothetical protein